MKMRIDKAKELYAKAATSEDPQEAIRLLTQVLALKVKGMQVAILMKRLQLHKLLKRLVRLKG